MRSSDRDDGPNSVIGRAMTVLACYGPADKGLSLAELTRRSGLAKPTVHRLLVELATWRLVERSDRDWVLGIQLFELGQMVPRQRELRNAAMPFLNDLHQVTRGTVHLAILDGAEIVYIEKLARIGSPELPSRVGGRGSLHCTGVGKALLAYSSDSLFSTIVAKGLKRRTPYTIVAPGILLKQLTDIRRCNIAYDREESTIGVTCVASPILDNCGLAVASISISGLTTHLKGSRVETAVQTTALGISRQLRTFAKQELRSLDRAC
jgi:IclR family transcriptional regulator, acetate operon repressor